jgi:predicted Fe-Mo cluster-binding NifX family protein
MKIAISSQDGKLTSPVEQRFGRCPAFIIFDTETEKSEIIDNSKSLNSPGGAGIQTSQMLSNSGVEAIITGHLGPNAHRTLTAAGISGYAGIGMSAQEAIEALKNGKLTLIAGADVAGHWK